MTSKLLGQTNLNVFAAAREFVHRICTASTGLKALLLDSETSAFVSAVASQTDLLSDGIVLVDQLSSSANAQNAASVRAIVFVRPTQANISAVCSELSRPRYAAYDLHFTNVIPRDALDTLAKADIREVVKMVRETPLDFVVHNPDFATAVLSPTTLPNERAASTIVACLAANKRRPLSIRYQSNSAMCRDVAEKVKTTLGVESTLFGGRRGAETVLLIVDRRADPLTPLLTQWTYQAMVHNAIGINNGRVNVLAADGRTSEEFNLNILSDPFWQRNIYTAWGDLCSNVKSFVEDFQKMQGGVKKTGDVSINELKAVIEQMPEFRRLGGEVAKHVNMMDALGRDVKGRKLYGISVLEQELSCSAPSHSEHFRRVTELVSDPTTDKKDALRLVMLYALRYEKETADINKLKEALLLRGLGTDHTEFVTAVLRYGGATARSGGLDLYQKERSVGTILSNQIKGMRDVANVYTQHESLVYRLAQLIIKSKLSDVSYPFLLGPDGSGRISEIIIYVCGGATYEEALSVSAINDPTCPAAATASSTGSTPVTDTKVLLLSDYTLSISAFMDVLASYRLSGN